MFLLPSACLSNQPSCVTASDVRGACFAHGLNGKKKSSWGDGGSFADNQAEEEDVKKDLFADGDKYWEEKTLGQIRTKPNRGKSLGLCQSGRPTIRAGQAVPPHRGGRKSLRSGD